MAAQISQWEPHWARAFCAAGPQAIPQLVLIGNQSPDRMLVCRNAMPEMRTMTILKWALIFLVVSIIAGLFGFTGISAASADIARFLFYVFVAIFLVLLILGLTIFRA